MVELCPNQCCVKARSIVSRIRILETLHRNLRYKYRVAIRLFKFNARGPQTRLGMFQRGASFVGNSQTPKSYKFVFAPTGTLNTQDTEELQVCVCPHRDPKHIYKTPKSYKFVIAPTGTLNTSTSLCLSLHNVIHVYWFSHDTLRCHIDSSWVGGRGPHISVARLPPFRGRHNFVSS